MKSRTILILILIYFPNIGFNQQYQELVIENANWLIAYFDDKVGIDPFGFKINGDTIVNNITYKKVYKLDLFPNEMNGPYSIENKYLYSLIREDVQSRKVYTMPFELYGGQTCAINEEILLYDFSKEIGDTLNECINIQEAENPIIIESIDTINIWGSDRRRMINTMGEGDQLIEGIGYKDGLYIEGRFYWQTLNWGRYLYGYCIGTDEECGLLTSIKRMENKTIKIYPNPVNDQLRIEIEGTEDQGEIQEIRIRNMIGQELFRRNDIQSKEYKVRLTDRERGILIIEIELRGGERIIKKIMKR